jgi:predicted aminopeptidase
MRSLPRLLTLLAVASSGLLSACALPYYWQAVGGQLELLRKRTPIAIVLEDPAMTAATKNALRQVVEIRRYAVDELGLPDNGSYRSYAELGRPSVVWNVIAAPEFSVEAEQWCFPFAGCVKYRGYFEEANARRFALRLDAQGMDTYIAGASAYSTLGYFDDPVLDTMLTGGEEYVVGVLFHELAHQRFYIKGDSELNEAFATVVEEYGTQSWLRGRGEDQALAAYRQRLFRRADFARLVMDQQARLRDIYARALPPESKRAAKAEAFQAMRAEYEALRQTWGGAGDYDAWFSGPLNNAQLASVATYRRWMPGLRWYVRHRGLEAFYAEMEELGGLPEEARRVRLEGWAAAALSARQTAAAAPAPAGGGRGRPDNSVPRRPWTSQ